MELEDWLGENARSGRGDFFCRDDDLRTNALLVVAGIQGDAAASEVIGCATALRYPASESFFFTRTTVILAKPSSNAGGFSFAAIRRITSSGTTRSRRS